jgi:hypothetical protein
MDDFINLVASLITLANAAYWSIRLRQPVIGLFIDIWSGDMLLALRVIAEGELF